MEMIHRHNILIVGLGLMGGSYAKALSRMGYHVFAIDWNAESIDYAISEGIIEDGAVYPDEKLVGSADIVIFALYPRVLIEWLKENQHLFKPGIYITDVTGVKGSIVYEVQGLLRDDVEFIAAHPMAGREVYGVKNADDKMFRDANYIVVPTDKNTPEAIEWCRTLGYILGTRRVSVLSPEEHDEMIAYVSQLTHCIAVSLMTCNDNPHLVDYTGDSFRDLTRIARINEDMWSELFFMNKEKLTREMGEFIDELTKMKEMIENEDAESLKEKMRISTARRALFDKPKK